MLVNKICLLEDTITLLEDKNKKYREYIDVATTEFGKALMEDYEDSLKEKEDDSNRTK